MPFHNRSWYDQTVYITRSVLLASILWLWHAMTHRCQYTPLTGCRETWRRWELDADQDVISARCSGATICYHNFVFFAEKIVDTHWKTLTWTYVDIHRHGGGRRPATPGRHPPHALAAVVSLDHGLQVKVASGILTTLNSILDELAWTSMFSLQVLQHGHMIFMSSSMVVTFWLYCGYSVLTVTVSSRCLSCDDMLGFVWVIQFVWWRPFLGSESEHVVPTTFLEPAVKWVSLELRAIHMLPKRCSDMQKSLVCGIHCEYPSISHWN